MGAGTEKGFCWLHNKPPGTALDQGRNAAMEQPGLHERHRNKTGEISRKHGNTLIGTLRKTYGKHFADSCADNETLNDVLHKLDEPSLSKLLHDHDQGRLSEICR